jgi:hypothetical protein
MVTLKGKPTTKCKKCNRESTKKYYAKEHGTHKEREAQKSTLILHIETLRSKGYTLQQIADETGFDVSTISLYLRGERQVSMKAVNKWNRFKKSKRR